MTSKCIACGKVLERPYMRLQFVGKPDSRLEGVGAMYACAGCVSIKFQERGIELPSQPSIVTVNAGDFGFTVDCAECADLVAIKAEREDAELAAARHLANVHSGIAA